MAAEIRFAGFEGELLDLNGGYGRDTASNHGKPTFKKIDSGTQTVMIYYWDERDGVQLRGWWVAPEVGGSNVWAMNTSTSNFPPVSGWRVPWHGEVNPKVTLSKSHIAGPGMVGADKRTLDQTGWGAQQQQQNKFQRIQAPNGQFANGAANGAANVAGAKGAYGQQQQQQQQQQGYGAFGGAAAGRGAGMKGANAYGGANAYTAGAAGRGAGANFGAFGGAAPVDPEEQRRQQAEKAAAAQKAQRELQEQQRVERRLAESVNGCVLATSNAERAFQRVRDSQSVSQLFAMDNMKATELSRWSNDVEKGLKAALCSLQSADTLQERKIQEVTSHPNQSKQVAALQQQLQTSKTKLETCQKEAKAFQERLSQRQKLLWGNLMGSLSDKSREEVEAAEQALESLKDTSALLSSEIAEHLSPAEAIKAADDAHVAAQKATDAISSCRTNLTQRRTEIMQAINMNADESLKLPEKKQEHEHWMGKMGPMLQDVERIRTMSVQIGNRARQAEAIRRKQELKERQKRKQERKNNWNRQLTTS